MDTINDSTIYDDDHYINDCSSYKRKITIVEKIFIIASSFLCFPMGLYFCTLVSKELSEYLNLFTFPQNLLFASIWIVLFFVLMFTEFNFKNFSLYKGVFMSSAMSFIWSFLYVCVGGSIISLINKEGASYWLNISAFSALMYTAFLLIIRLITGFLNHFQLKAVMIIGPKDDAEALARRLIEKHDKRTKVRFVFYEINGKIDDKVYKKFYYTNEIILLNTLSAKAKEEILLYFNSCLNKDIYLCSSYLDVIMESPSVKNIGGVLSLEQKPLRIDFVEGTVKRIFDILCSLLLIILTLPVWIIVPIMIKIDSKGPVFYRQERYTKDLKTFKIFKFRSMCVDADPNKPAAKGDARITKVGKFIRATRIDEIPQVLNVLKGDMSFVGPRALMHGDVDERLKENPEYKYRFNVKAGITGLQQVRTNPGCDYEQKLRYDLYYISQYSLILDIKILFLTVKTVLSKSMADGVNKDNYTFQEFLQHENKEFNQHDSYIRVLNHKRRIDPKTGFIIPLEEINKSERKVRKINKRISKK